MRRALYPTAFATAIATLAPFLAAAPFVRACALDGKPSAYADGVPAVVVRTAPTVATYVWWAHFAFPRSFRAGQHIRFNEDDASVRRLLPPAARSRPWRWRFADGNTLIGDRVAHVYRRPGRYKLSVEAYFPSYGWQAFDTITVTIHR